MALEHELQNRRLGDFEIIREIGRGGMGVVYEARQVSLNRKVALKVLSGGLGLTPKAVQRFCREAEAAAKLHHTNIVPVHATGEENGTHFYAMELIDGPSLDHVIRQMRAVTSNAGPPSTASGNGSDGSPDLVQTGPYIDTTNLTATPSGLSSSSLGSASSYFDTVARMIAEVADALEHAHQEGVIHRDMKPSNLLLSSSGRLSINDFGLARMLEQPGMTMTGEFVGTPAYMSPEQITAGRTPLDRRTDVYSLGATLYELLTLHPPFTGERRDQVLAQILHKEPKAPRKVNPKVPVDLETICLKAMEKDPDRHYQTAGAMAEDLRRYVNRFAISARRAGPAERFQKWIKRHPGLAAGVLLALMGISLAGFFGIQAWRDRQERIAAAAVARKERLHEKQQKVVHDILMGDFKAAANAISEAEELGAPEAWVQWRQGQIAFHNGEWEEAIQLLEPAAIEMPDSLALNWLLALVYRLNGDDDRFAEIAGRIDSLPARTEEEFIYKGFALTPYTPKQSLALFDEAIKARGSLVAFGLRAMCRIRLAFNQNDLSILKPAMDDAAAAKSIMSDNPLAHVNSLIVHYSASILYEQGEKTKESEEALRIATEEANALEAFPNIPLAVNVRGIFLADLGKNEEAIQWFEMCTKHKKLARGPTDHYAWQLYERGEADKALQIIEQVAPRGRMSFSRGIFAAEAKDGGLHRALMICDEMESEQSVEGRFRRLALLFFLGEKEKALNLLGKYPPKPGPRASDKLYERVAHYWKDPTADKEKQLLDFASGSKASLVYAHWYIAFRLLGDGDRNGARQHFKACMALHYPYFLGYLESRALLAQMDRDANWPWWIPAKKP
jgi:serine/threonine protein kinase